MTYGFGGGRVRGNILQDEVGVGTILMMIS